MGIDAKTLKEDPGLKEQTRCWGHLTTGRLWSGARLAPAYRHVFVGLAAQKDSNGMGNTGTKHKLVKITQRHLRPTGNFLTHS
jgi:hypothetical protein